jgi:hypothetical protein
MNGESGAAWRGIESLRRASRVSRDLIRALIRSGGGRSVLMSEC